MASIYRHRNSWQASVTVNGQNQKKNFPTKKEANAWAASIATELQHAHAPHLGGPAHTTVARMLFDYAKLYSVGKRGISQELARINRYLVAAHLPTWTLMGGEGQRQLTSVPPNEATSLPSAFVEHRQARCNARATSNALRAQLAHTRAAHVSKAQLRQLIATMQHEGLSGSTIRKECALLKHAFNMAINEWNWSGFNNPLQGLRLPNADAPRDRALSAATEAHFTTSLQECRNPYVLPLFQFAIETTARRGSLLKLCWRDIDVEARTAVLHRTKNGRNVAVPLTLRALEILRTMPRVADEDRVFPLTSNALQLAWQRACERAGLEDVVFHDTRHTGATRHARRLRSTHLLKKITGHESEAMLARYVHFMHDDVLSALDETEPNQSTTSPPEVRPVSQPSPRADSRVVHVDFKNLRRTG